MQNCYRPQMHCTSRYLTTPSRDELDDRDAGARLPPRFLDVDDESVLLLLSPLILEEERDAEDEEVDFFLSESLDRPGFPLADRSLATLPSFFDDLLLEALFPFFGSPLFRSSFFSAAPEDDDALSSDEEDLPDRIELLLRWLVLERLDLEGRLLALELSLVF